MVRGALGRAGLVLLLVGCGALPAQAGSNVVSFAPGSLLWGQVALEYERPVAPGLSVTVAGNRQFNFGLTGLVTDLLATTTGTELSVSGLGGVVGVRYYFVGKAPVGLFVSPELSVNSVRLEAQNRDVEGSTDFLAVALTGLFGVSLAPEGAGPALSLGVGLTAGHLGLVANLAGLDVKHEGFYALPAVRLSVGGTF